MGKHAIKKLEWFWNRLRCMSILELGYRLVQSTLTWSERIGIATAHKVPQAGVLPSAVVWCDLNKSLLNTEAYVQAADRVLSGDLNVFALQPAHLGHPPRWNKDPLTGCEAPLQFGSHISLTDRTVIGDIKYLWEPNRHLHWVTLAQAYYLTREQRFLDGLALQLESWLDQCPYLQGANWSSSLELALRLMNWSIVWPLIGGAQSEMFSGSKGQVLQWRWLEAVYRHCHFVNRHLSAHSSANNHLMGELAGLYLAADTWPIWPQSRLWKLSAKQKLLEEVLEQNAVDGVNKEQAISYQQFVLDFLIFCGLAGRRSGDEFPQAYWQRIESMMEFLASIMDKSGNVPMWGDADDGFAVRLHTAEKFSSYRSLLATGAALFHRADFKAKAGQFDEKSLWLLGQQGVDVFNELDAENVVLPVRLDFPGGGYYIVGSDFETEREVRLIVDCAPLGYLGIAAHGHADALSLVLSIGGKEILVDPGTYSYHAAQGWRDYFRGTSAHNTVRVDGVDQSISGGRFMWVQKAQTICEHISRQEDGSALFMGSHNGYRRLNDPVTHERTIEFNAAERIIYVIDRLICESTHSIELFWHFDEHCTVEIESGLAIVQRDNVRVHVTMPENKGLSTLLKGCEEPIAGWISRSYDSKIETFTLKWQGFITGSTVLKTTFNWYG